MFIRDQFCVHKSQKILAGSCWQDKRRYSQRCNLTEVVAELDVKWTKSRLRLNDKFAGGNFGVTTVITAIIFNNIVIRCCLQERPYRSCGRANEWLCKSLTIVWCFRTARASGCRWRPSSSWWMVRWLEPRTPLDIRYSLIADSNYLSVRQSYTNQSHN